MHVQAGEEKDPSRPARGSTPPPTTPSGWVEETSKQVERFPRVRARQQQLAAWPLERPETGRRLVQ